MQIITHMSTIRHESMTTYGIENVQTKTVTLVRLGTENPAEVFGEVSEL